MTFIVNCYMNYISTVLHFPNTFKGLGSRAQILKTSASLLLLYKATLIFESLSERFLDVVTVNIRIFHEDEGRHKVA